MHTSSIKLRFVFVAGGAAVLAAGLFSACYQQHVFNSPLPTACRTVIVPKKVDVQRSADILVVVDNSGSMIEEQENLAKNSSSIASAQRDGTTTPCSTAAAVRELRDFMRTGPGAAEPDPTRWDTLPGGAGKKAVLDDCGFIERLQLFDNDFQIGIITSDLNPEDAWGPRRRPDGTLVCNPTLPNARTPTKQRGCLQPVPGKSPGWPSVAGPSPIITRSDDIAAVANQFYNAVSNVSVCGAAAEQGLEAVRTFLTNGAERADPVCAQQFQNFLRGPVCLKADGGDCVRDSEGNEVLGPAPKLVVLILSDEEDCSYVEGVDGGDYATRADKCYSRPEGLIPTPDFVNFLRNLKGDPDLVSMAAIVGGYTSGNEFVAGNCRCNDTAAGAPPIAESCHQVLGNSIVSTVCGPTANAGACGVLPYQPATLPDGGPNTRQECCTADRGARYVDVARGMKLFVLDSICEQNYKDTMIAVADLANESGLVGLGEAPADPARVVVERRTGDGEWSAVPVGLRDPATGNSVDRTDPRFTSCSGCPCDSTTAGGADCNVTCDGFSLVNNCTTVKFHGGYVPTPGTEIRISFLGESKEGAPKCQ